MVEDCRELWGEIVPDNINVGKTNTEKEWVNLTIWVRLPREVKEVCGGVCCVFVCQCERISPRAASQLCTLAWWSVHSRGLMRAALRGKLTHNDRDGVSLSRTPLNHIKTISQLHPKPPPLIPPPPNLLPSLSSPPPQRSLYARLLN